MRQTPWVVGLILVPLCGMAQQVTPPLPVSGVSADSLYAHAQRLVNEGRGVEGRNIVDSLFRVAAPGSLLQAEALFWRATLATTAAEAERDYRLITVDHPLSRRAEDALLRLAQLELQRGERAAALAHLDRLLREHGNGPARARGAYWMARVHFDANDITRACQSLGDARASPALVDVELRNQIEYASQRCPTTTVLSATAVATPPAARDTTTRASSATIPRDTASRPTVDTTAPPRTVAVVLPAPAAASTPARASATGNAPVRVSTTTNGAEAPQFSVQVAAYQTKPEADRLVTRFRANGHDARTFGTVAPFRVRIGRFRTRSEAVVLAKVLKEKSGAAFVVVAEAR